MNTSGWTRVVWVFSIAGVAAIFLLGYYFGRRSVSVSTTTTVRVVQGDSVRFSVPIPPVSEVVYPSEVELQRLLLRDTVYRDSVVYLPVDTVGILRDYYARRQYNLDFSTDSLGTYKVSCSVFQNRLCDVSSTIVPRVRYIDRVTTVTEKSALLRPWVFAGCSTKFDFQYGLVGTDIGGRYMVGVGGYHHNDVGSGVLFGVGVKFGSK